jgi:hypothetical protein
MFEMINKIAAPASKTASIEIKKALTDLISFTLRDENNIDHRMAINRMIKV